MDFYRRYVTKLYSTGHYRTTQNGTSPDDTGQNITTVKNNTSDKHLNLLSIDVEENFHGEYARNLNVPHVPKTAENVPPILNLLKQYKQRATFFCVSVSTPDSTLKQISDSGNEIAFHSFDHVPLHLKNENLFTSELRDFKVRVKNLVGFDVVGFRAPSFSVTPWLFSCLKKAGYLYDSSVFPMKTNLYGDSRSPLVLYDVQGVKEFPISVGTLFGRKVPVAGGFYARLLPKRILLSLLKRTESRRGLCLYFHNWEVANDTIPVPFFSKANLYFYNVGSTLPKLRTLLAKYKFVPFREVLNNVSISNP